MLNFKAYYLNEQPAGGISAPAALPPGGLPPMGGGGMGGAPPLPPMGGGMGGGMGGLGGPPMGGMGGGTPPPSTPSIKIQPLNFWKIAEKMLSGDEKPEEAKQPEKKRSGLLLGM